MSRLLRSLGTVRLSHRTRRDSVTRSGRQITAWTDEHLIAEVRQRLAHRDQWDCPTESPRVTLVDRVVAVAAQGGTQTWGNNATDQ